MVRRLPRSTVQHLHKGVVSPGVIANKDAGNDGVPVPLGRIHQLVVPALKEGRLFATAVVGRRMKRRAQPANHADASRPKAAAKSGA